MKRRIKKLDPRASWPRPISDEERAHILGYLEERFGFSPTLFKPYLFLATAKNYWLFTRTEHFEALQSLRVQTAGLLFLRKVSGYLKPTSAALQRFGRFATRNIVILDRLTLDRLRLEKKIPFSAELEPGYVILKCEEDFWGCALYISGKLISYLP
ncbi:MAG TPA: hypothetical protein EYP81_04100 [Thermodesulfobacteriaceae bacterium]|nr:hypothetical protein [Thermodesulfobacteriaceae bacterium]